ncbi:unnamed protein product [Meganyctiphanes norvegica]|uniref:LRRCT domain-containing protein n=1 Tax=Meganyctiphanes norvegica TaxID=48144 RepID=A0AAV2R6D5_MEGNR
MHRWPECKWLWSWYHIWLTTWLWMGLLCLTNGFCPSGCTCDDSPPSAYCEEAGMDVVPILLNPRIKSLNLANNDIRSVEQAFAFYDKLEKLDLSHNIIKIIGTNNFIAQLRLKELSIAHNNITHLPLKSFSGLHHLVLLDLSHNNIKDLPMGLLKDIPSLKVILLGHNHLHSFPVNIFKNQKFLHVLDLSHNYFREAPTKAILELSALKVLNLSRNRLTSIENNQIPNEALNKLYLQSNNIQSIDDSSFKRLQRLQTLDLSDNLLLKVPSIALSKLEMLELLILNKNNFTIIKSNTFSALKHLKILEVSQCSQLKSVHPTALASCNRLHTLKMSHNPLLTTFAPGVISSLPRFSTLDISGNGLKGLSELSLPWASLTILDLRDNPLECNCSLTWLANILAQPNASINTQDVQCSTPEELRNVYLSRLSQKELQCPNSVRVAITIAVVSISFIMMAVLSIVFFRCRQKHRQEKSRQDWVPSSLHQWPHDSENQATIHVSHNEYIHHPQMYKSNIDGKYMYQAPESYIVVDDIAYHTYATIKKVPISGV